MIVSKKKHKTIVESLINDINEAKKETKDAMVFYQKMISDQKKHYEKDIIPIIKKLININWIPSNDPEIHRLVTHISADMIRHAFTHGNDDYFIQEIADRVKYEIIRELKTINFSRINGEHNK